MPTPLPADPTQVLRRSRTGRVGAGVAGGLGNYFGLDPVLFRVLFATSAFFGGAGILAYLLAWAAIPEEGTERAPIDGWIGKLRRRHVPVWVVAAAAGLFLWIVAFSWWAPGPFVPVVAVVILLVVAFGRGDLQGTRTPPPAVSLSKDADRPGAPPADQPRWARELHSWWSESREASRVRRHRALPVKITALVGLGTTVIVLAVIDAAVGIPIAAYFWTGLGFVAGGLLVGAVLRRTPWSIATLLPVSIAGALALAGSHASLHDGLGQRDWAPTNLSSQHYRLAAGQGTLDLREVGPQTVPHTVRVTVGAGQIRVLVPENANVRVEANVHIGRVTVDGDVNSGTGGVGLSKTIPAPAGATGARITVAIHLADGQIKVEHR